MENLNLSFSLDNNNLSILEEDDNILLTEMYVVSTGDSRPVSLDGKACVTNFSLEAIKDASSTLLNKPIVCVWNKWQGDFKNHAITPQDIQARVAIGVVPESCNIEYREIEGKTFLVCKVAFWKKYFPEEVRKIAENTLNNKPTNLSMEISVIDGHFYGDDKQYYIIDKFKFEGVSLLGENIATGIADAQMNTIKFSAIENLNDVINETNKMFLNYEEKKGDNNKVELTKNQIREILKNALSSIDCWICDFNDSYVYVEFYDIDDNNTYKVPYTLNAETKVATVDIESKSPVIRGGFVDVIEGEKTATYEEALAECKKLDAECKKLNAEKTELETKCSEVETAKCGLEEKCSELETKCAEFSTLQTEKETLETNFNSVNAELSQLKEETVVKYARLVELEDMFAKQEKESLIASAQDVVNEVSAYFSEDEKVSLMKEFEDKYLSKDGLVTFSTIVKAQAQPKVQAELNILREKLNNIKPEDTTSVEFSSGSVIENIKKEEPNNVWSRLGL